MPSDIRRVVVAGKERHLAGWSRDRPDLRDKSLAPIGTTPESKGFAVSAFSSLTSFAPPVYDQGGVGCCVSFGTLTAAEMLFRRKGHKAPTFSKLYHYYMARVLCEGKVPWEDSGMEVRDGMKALAKYGACLEATWPYQTTRFHREPNMAARQEAYDFKALRYYRLTSVSWIKASLTLGYPVVFGFAVPKAFVTATADTGMMPFPDIAEEFTGGGHCVLAIGHDDEKAVGLDRGALLCRNSWGLQFGDAGNFWMPYKWFEKYLALDPWSLHELKDGERSIS